MGCGYDEGLAVSWGGWSEFLAMGGYALYVWGSYAIALGLIACEIVVLVLRKRNILKHLGRGSATVRHTTGGRG